MGGWEITRSRVATGFWIVWIAAIVFVFPIPGTIALRNALLLLGIVVLLILGRSLFPKGTRWLRTAGIVWCLLTIWIAVQAFVFADLTASALDLWRSGWLNPMLIGFIAAWAATWLGSTLSLRTAIMALTAHAVWLLGWQLYLRINGGNWPFKATPFAAYDYHSTLIGFLLALLVADRVIWLRQRHSPLGLNRIDGWTLLLLSLAADIALQARNGTLVDLAILGVGALLIIDRRGVRQKHAALALLTVILLGAATFQFDERWRGLRESARIGWTSNSSYWLKATAENRPATPSGAVLEESAYFRVAWAHRAIEFVAERPMGNGFGHEAFGRGIASRFGITGFGSSHSSLLDYAIGIGLPGVALLIFLAAVTLISGWRAYSRQGNEPALLIAFLCGSYFVRCILDGHLSGWRFSLFGFLFGLLFAATAGKSRQSR